MRNLKKFLALVLAMVMAFSLMLSAGAVDYADYKDKDSITAEFTEAVQVLTGLKVMQGDENGFRPGDSITRAEAAAIVYRIATGDVNDAQVKIYADYSNFADVSKDDWFAGYVGYCQNAGYIKGTTPTTFNPYGKVTGYEALAMILRVVGYGKNNEFVGSEWQVNVAALSKQLGVTRNVVNANFDTTLNYAARRDVVADLMFMTMATVPTVTYTPALAYNDKQSVLTGATTPFNPTLGQKIFGLFYSTSWQTIDEWGRPGYYWWQGGAWNNQTLTTTATGKAYMTPENHPVYTKIVGTGAASNYTATRYDARQGLVFANQTPDAIAWREANLVATITMKPDYETKVQVRECDVAHELGIAVEDTFRLYVNGLNGGDIVGASVPNAAINNDYRIVATDTVTKVGGQGRVSEFYYQMTNPWFWQDTPDNRAVMIDTMLARVTGKTDAKLDKNNHVIVPAQLEVTIWDGPNAGPNAIATTASDRIIQKAANDATNWTEYGKGDYILLNAWTNKDLRATDEQRDMAAFETDKVIPLDIVAPYSANILTSEECVWVLGKADHQNGKQSTIYYNQNRHNVDGKDYDDQLCLFMDRAGNNLNTTYTWYFDQYGNLIGIGDASASRFGVITSVYAAISTDDTDTTGGVKAVATVRYTDGTTGTVTVDSFLMSNQAATTGALSLPTLNANSGNGTNSDTLAATQLTAGANTIELIPVYDEATHPAMSAGPITSNLVGSSGDAAAIAWIYMAPSAATNLNNHFGAAAGNCYDVYGILYDNLFEFTTASDDSVVAVEVAGEWVNNDSTNTGMYVDKANGIASNNATVTDANDAYGKVYKSLGYLALNTVGTSVTATVAADAYLDNDTQILVRNGRSLAAYTLETLPSDITLGLGTQADWADIDNDGRIDYLYVTGTVAGTTTYNLFYYNGGAAQWSSNGGTIEGYLNGEAATITFSAGGLGMFNAISNSPAGYDGHLFAIRIVNDVVNSVMYVDGLNTNAFAQSTREILKAYDAVSGEFYNANGQVIGSFGANIDTAANGTGTKFGLGSGNSYTANTEAVYWRDYATADGTLDNDGVSRHTNASYVRVSNGYQIQVTGTLANGTGVSETYWISPSAKIVGELEWLNQYECDVTIVYENTSSNAAVQVYITPDPDVTPVGPGGTLATRPIGGAVIAGGNTDALLANSIANGAANTLVYGQPAVTAGASAEAVFTANHPGYNNITNQAGDPLADYMFFPFSLSTTGSVTFRLLDENSNQVYAQTASFTVGTDVMAFGVNFRGTANNTGTVAGGGNRLSLWSGATYRWEIIVAAPTGNVTVSTGSFTMA